MTGSSITVSVCQNATRALKTSLLPAFFSVALLSACGSPDGTTAAADTQSKVKIADTVESDPCSLLPRHTLADRFSLAVDDIKQIAISSTCRYDWKNKTDTLKVSVNVARVADTAAEAADYFDSATRSMRADEVSDAVAKIRAETEGQGEDNILASAVGSDGGIGRGLTFEDVADIGDRARFETASGKLHILYGNLYFDVAAYHGPGLQIPEGTSLQSLGKVSAEWEQETMPERKATAQELARLILSGL